MLTFNLHDGWAVSTLKQSFDWKGDEECQLIECRLNENCTMANIELDLDCYAKPDLSLFLEWVVSWTNEEYQSHHWIIYPFWDLEVVLGKVSHFYEVP